MREGNRSQVPCPCTPEAGSQDRRRNLRASVQPALLTGMRARTVRARPLSLDGLKIHFSYRTHSFIVPPRYAITYLNERKHHECVIIENHTRYRAVRRIGFPVRFSQRGACRGHGSGCREFQSSPESCAGKSCSRCSTQRRSGPLARQLECRVVGAAALSFTCHVCFTTTSFVLEFTASQRIR